MALFLVERPIGRPERVRHAVQAHIAVPRPDPQGYDRVLGKVEGHAQPRRDMFNPTGLAIQAGWPALLQYRLSASASGDNPGPESGHPYRLAAGAR